MIMTPNLLYIDTESDESTKQPLSIQWRFGGNHGIITEFNIDTWKKLASLWDAAEGVIMFNAPYDMGVLSGAYPGRNSWKWRDVKYADDHHSGYWDLKIFGNRYKVRRIAGFRNLIKPLSRVTDATGTEHNPKKKRPKSTPVIDLLKLWSIFVDDGRENGIGLKKLIKRELKKKPIQYSSETATTDEYRYQDVDCLEELWELFLERTSGIPGTADMTYERWGDIKTPATLTKWAYEDAYSELGSFQKENIKEDNKHNLEKPLESAYHGGLTISLYRGTLDNTAWIDLHGAYASCIESMNTDRWLKYRWEEVSPGSRLIKSRNIPILCEVRSTVMMTSINNSLKVFTTKQPHRTWIWNFDISALSLIFPGSSVDILKAYRPIPLNECKQSLAGRWNKLKNEEKKKNGKTTLYDYYKFLSNTSYGIKAQRKPFTTKHTNLAIAGIITSRVHLALIEMVDECQKMGLHWYYSDTDSVCIQGDCPQDIEERINRRISPFSAGNEGFEFTTRILSLKRYTSIGGKDAKGKPVKDKIRLHGKGRYRITEQTISEGLDGTIDKHKPLVLSQLAANTERTMHMLVKAHPPAAEHIHPFAFHTNIKTEISLGDWFRSWKNHIDTKTTFPEGALSSSEFEREFWVFSSYFEAVKYYGSVTTEEEPEDLAGDRGEWDKEAAFCFPVGIKTINI